MKRTKSRKVIGVVINMKRVLKQRVHNSRNKIILHFEYNIAIYYIFVIKRTFKRKPEKQSGNRRKVQSRFLKIQIL